MIKSVLNNEILKRITAIEENRVLVSTVSIPHMVRNKLRKNSKKKSSYASNKIEGNPLTEKQASDAIDSDPHKHFLRPEQEVRNYFLALSYLEEQIKQKTRVSIKMIMDVQAMTMKGASKEKIGLRKAMPPGVLFAVYDSESGNADYIPPEYSDIPGLLEELVDYINLSDDHPLIIAAIAHYQLVTIHPFEDGNGRTARLISGYILDYFGYGFQGIGSLEEYFSYDLREYYDSLQMGLPALYYSGRDNPPHPEIWFHYFLRMVELYSKKVYELSKSTTDEKAQSALTHLNDKEKSLLKYIFNENIREFTPIELGRSMGISNRTIINRLSKLVHNGFLTPILVRERVRSYVLTDFALENKKAFLEYLDS